MLAITLPQIPFIIWLVLGLISLILFEFKTFIYRKLNILPLGAILLFITILILMYSLIDNHLVNDIILAVLSCSLCGYIVFDYIDADKIRNHYAHKATNLIKNAPFDYYYATDKKDKIVDFSESFLELSNSEPSELYKTLGLQTLLAQLNILTINGQEFSEPVALKFHYDYMNTAKTNNPAHFYMTLLENEEEIECLGIVEPIICNKRFVGRNIYLAKSNKETLRKIQAGLTEALNAIKDDRAQLYSMMSMVENVVMYYDYNTSTYVVTEQMAKMLNLVQREFSIGEFIGMIHPQDLPRYQEQSTIISSIEVSRLRYRLKLGDKYYPILDDVMYLNRDANLISVIHLEEYNSSNDVPEVDIIKETKEKVESTENLEDVNYQDKILETLKMLEKVLGDDDE